RDDGGLADPPDGPAGSDRRLGRRLPALRGLAGLRDGLLSLGRELHGPGLWRHRDATRLAPARPARGRERRPDVRPVGRRPGRRDGPAARVAAQTPAPGSASLSGVAWIMPA